MLTSALRAMLVAGILVSSLAIALFVGLTFARFGYLGSCQDGACELIAAVYVMPALGLALYLLALAALSLAARRANAGEQP